MGDRHQLLVRWRIAIAAAVLVLISIPLMRTLIRVAEQANVRSQVQNILKQSLGEHRDRQLDSVNVRIDNGRLDVEASIQTAEYIEASVIDHLTAVIENQIGKSVHLQVQQLQLARKRPGTEQLIRDFLAAGLTRPTASQESHSPAADIDSLQQRLKKSLDALVGAASVTVQVKSVGREKNGTVVIDVLAHAPQLTSADMWTVAASGLAKWISTPVDVNGTVAATGTVLELTYRDAADLPPRAELRRLRKFTASLPPEVGLGFVWASELDQPLGGRRIARLRHVVSRSIEKIELQPPADKNSLILAPVRTITAKSVRALDGAKHDGYTAISTQ